MNFVEYWILDNAFERPIPFFVLDSEFEEYGVRQLIHYDRKKLFDGFETLRQQKLITIHDGKKDLECLSQSLLNEFLESEYKYYRNDGWIEATYRLTELGGETWAALSNADWDRYVSETWEDWNADDGSGTEVFLATTRKRIEEFLQEVVLTTVVDGTQSWERLSPLKLTYWKEIPSGIRLKCKTVQEKGEPSTGDSGSLWRDSRWDWYTPPDFARELK